MKRIIFILLVAITLYAVNWFDNGNRYPNSSYRFPVFKYMSLAERDSVFMVSKDSLFMFFRNNGFMDTVSFKDSLGQTNVVVKNNLKIHKDFYIDSQDSAHFGNGRIYEAQIGGIAYPIVIKPRTFMGVLIYGATTFVDDITVSGNDINWGNGARISNPTGGYMSINAATVDIPSDSTFIGTHSRTQKLYTDSINNIDYIKFSNKATITKDPKDSTIILNSKIKISKILYIAGNDSTSTPLEGEIFYDFNLHVLKCWNGTAWKRMWE